MLKAIESKATTTDGAGLAQFSLVNTSSGVGTAADEYPTDGEVDHLEEQISSAVVNRKQPPPSSLEGTSALSKAPPPQPSARSLPDLDVSFNNDDENDDDEGRNYNRPLLSDTSNMMMNHHQNHLSDPMLLLEENKSIRWTCPTCLHENADSSRLTCAMCGNHKKKLTLSSSISKDRSSTARGTTGSSARQAASESAAAPPMGPPLRRHPSDGLDNKVVGGSGGIIVGNKNSKKESLGMYLNRHGGAMNATSSEGAAMDGAYETRSSGDGRAGLGTAASFSGRKRRGTSMRSSSSSVISEASMSTVRASNIHYSRPSHESIGSSTISVGGSTIATTSTGIPTPPPRKQLMLVTTMEELKEEGAAASTGFDSQNDDDEDDAEEKTRNRPPPMPSIEQGKPPTPATVSPFTQEDSGPPSLMSSSPASTPSTRHSSHGRTWSNSSLLSKDNNSRSSLAMVRQASESSRMQDNDSATAPLRPSRSNSMDSDNRNSVHNRERRVVPMPPPDKLLEEERGSLHSRSPNVSAGIKTNPMRHSANRNVSDHSSSSGTVRTVPMPSSNQEEDQQRRVGGVSGSTFARNSNLANDAEPNDSIDTLNSQAPPRSKAEDSSLLSSRFRSSATPMMEGTNDAGGSDASPMVSELMLKTPPPDDLEVQSVGVLFESSSRRPMAQSQKLNSDANLESSRSTSVGGTSVGTSYAATAASSVRRDGATLSTAAVNDATSVLTPDSNSVFDVRDGHSRQPRGLAILSSTASPRRRSATSSKERSFGWLKYAICGTIMALVLAIVVLVIILTGKEESSTPTALSANPAASQIPTPAPITISSRASPSPTPTSSSSWQLVESVVGDVSGGEMGHSVSLAANGTIMAVGPGNAGPVHVFQSSDGGWIPFGEPIDFDNEELSNGDDSPKRVALSARDGLTLAVATQIDSKVHVLGYNGKAWTPKGDPMMMSVSRLNSEIAFCLNDDGSILSVAVPNEREKGTGRVQVYQYTGEIDNRWIRLGSGVADDAFISAVESVDVSYESSLNAIAISGYFGPSQPNRVRVYQIQVDMLLTNNDDIAWTMRGNELEYPSNPNPSVGLGTIEANSNNLIVAVGDDHLYQLDDENNTWFATLGLSSHSSIDLIEKRLIFSGMSQFHVYEWSGEDLIGFQEEAVNLQGGAVGSGMALAQSGNSVVVGLPSTESNRGSVQHFRRVRR